jgi:uncharacterized radical SAM superfamily Fe-S cluster-containing enzyme
MTVFDGRRTDAVVGATRSVCPVCLKTIPAERRIVGDTVELMKTCPEHGDFSAPVWRGLASFLDWGARRPPAATPRRIATAVAHGCPQDCGLCPDHEQQSCCVLLEVTSRCDLACPVCYAAAGPAGRDLTRAEIDERLDTLAAAGGNVNIQLSGGEPTVRDDLPAIVAAIKARGFDFVQINTNGVRIAREPDFLAALVEAGLDCVFLQFDGIDDAVHRRLRGAPLAAIKRRAIAACAAAEVGVVLVPTIVPGVNDHEIGAIVDHAIGLMPTVRAVHFQPVAHFGRCVGVADEDRITLPEIVAALVAHSDGRLSFDDFRPGSAENPWCSFSGRFRVDEAGRLSARESAAASCCGPAVAEPEGRRVVLVAPSLDFGVPPKPAAAASTRCGPKPEPAASACCDSVRPSADVARARRYVVGQWTRPETPAPVGDGFDAVLAARARTLGLSGMAFQDAMTLDLDRLRRCHVHVVEAGGRVIPFCAHNLTDTAGRALHRGSPR